MHAYQNKTRNYQCYSLRRPPLIILWRRWRKHLVALSARKWVVRTRRQKLHTWEEFASEDIKRMLPSALLKNRFIPSELQCFGIVYLRHMSQTDYIWHESKRAAASLRYENNHRHAQVCVNRKEGSINVYMCICHALCFLILSQNHKSLPTNIKQIPSNQSKVINSSRFV
jgi:hypothetical protein